MVSPIYTSPVVKTMMADARRKYSGPIQSAAVQADAEAHLPKQMPPTPQQLEYKERLDTAYTSSSTLLTQALAAINTPVKAYLPKNLTPEENAERIEADAWSQGFETTDKYTDSLLDRSNDLFFEVMSSIDLLDEHGYRMPDASVLNVQPQTPNIEWLKAPREVKTWFKTSKQPLANAPQSIDARLAQYNSSAEYRKQLKSIANDLARHRNASDAADRSQVKVAELVSRYDCLALDHPSDLAAERARSQQVKEVCTCADSFAVSLSAPQPLSFVTGGDVGVHPLSMNVESITVTEDASYTLKGAMDQARQTVERRLSYQSTPHTVTTPEAAEDDDASEAIDRHNDIVDQLKSAAKDALAATASAPESEPSDSENEDEQSSEAVQRTRGIAHTSDRTESLYEDVMAQLKQLQATKTLPEDQDDSDKWSTDGQIDEDETETRGGNEPLGRSYDAREGRSRGRQSFGRPWRSEQSIEDKDEAQIPVERRDSGSGDQWQTIASAEVEVRECCVS